MLKRLKNYQLYVNLKKCRFVIIEIEFLNFIITLYKKTTRFNEDQLSFLTTFCYGLNHIIG